MTTRTTGSRVLSLENIGNASLNLAHPDNPVHQQSNDIAETALMFRNTIDADSSRFFADGSNDIITFARKSIEREHGEGEGSDIPDAGIVEVSGANDAEYKMSVALDVYKNGELQTIGGGAMSLMAHLSGSNRSRERMTVWGGGSVLACLNGMETTQALGRVRRKQTKTLQVRELIIEMLQQLADTYQGFGVDMNAMKSRTINRQEVADVLISARQLKVASLQNLGGVLDLFNDSSSPWFADDNQKPTVWRLYNAFTRQASAQNSSDVRKKMVQGVYWPLAHAGVFDLPKHCTFPASYQSLAVDGRTPAKTPFEVDERQTIIDVEPITLT
jgi:hypothetical protein